MKILPWQDGVVPIPMELGPRDLDTSKLLIGHLEARLIGVGVQFGVDPQSCLGFRIPNQVHHDGSADQRPPTPILRDMAEHAVLDLVPLTGPRGEMAYGDP